MEGVKSFSLPKLPYDYTTLAPYMSEQQLMTHHDKHHMGYVKGANALFEKLDKARKENTELDIKSTLKELSFQQAKWEFLQNLHLRTILLMDMVEDISQMN